MRGIYRISPEQLRPAGLDLVMAALQRGFDQFGVDAYLVGAVARDLWLTQVHGQPARRMTKDLDLAVFLHDIAEFEALRTWLLSHEAFEPARSSAFCLLYQLPAGGTLAVDVMPFGAIADEAGDVYLSGHGQERLSTVGFAEVLAGAASMAAAQGPAWRVVTLPGLVVLKLLAWQDRPERGKDATDVWQLLTVYFDLLTDEIYDRHADLLTEAATPDTANLPLLVGTRVLGRHMGQLLATSPVRARLQALLAAQLGDGERSLLAKGMSRSGPDLADCLAALTALQAGLAEA